MTQEIDITGAFRGFDVGVYESVLSSELTLTNAKAQHCYVYPAPTGSDIGMSGNFKIPSNYASTPVLVIRGIIDGTPANVLGWAATFLELNTSETVDAAYEAEDAASNSDWTGYADEEEFELTIALTPASAFTPGRTLYIRDYRDDSVDSQTINFLVTYKGFRYTES